MEDLKTKGNKISACASGLLAVYVLGSYGMAVVCLWRVHLLLRKNSPPGALAAAGEARSACSLQPSPGLAAAPSYAGRLRMGFLRL